MLTIEKGDSHYTRPSGERLAVRVILSFRKMTSGGVTGRKITTHRISIRSYSKQYCHTSAPKSSSLLRKSRLKLTRCLGWFSLLAENWFGEAWLVRARAKSEGVFRQSKQLCPMTFHLEFSDAKCCQNFCISVQFRSVNRKNQLL